MRIQEICFLVYSLLRTGDTTVSRVSMAKFWEKDDFNQLIKIAWEDKFSDIGEIAEELPGTPR